MEVACNQCSRVTTLEVYFEVVNFVCPKCQSVYNESNGLRFNGRVFLKSYRQELCLSVGQKGTLRGTEYTVSSSITKKAHGSFYWNEYTLQDQLRNFIYLSESDGNWILLKEADKPYDIVGRHQYTDYADLRMQLYEHTEVEIVNAAGFFDYQITTTKIPTTEYIFPPYILSVERVDGEETAFFGEHISRSEIKRAFHVSTMPVKVGTGIVQPFFINIKNFAMIFCVVAILILSSHMIIYSGRTQTDVLRETFVLGDSNNKEFVSPTFTLNGGSAPLTVKVESDIDNSWLNVQVALINEQTGEEIYANKDVEYYHGYTDGESWSEGDQSETLQVCGVTSGKYHLLFTPQWAPENSTGNSLKVTAVWNEPSMWNVWLPIIIMGGFVVVMYYANVGFEQKRWSESDYSTYD